MGVDKRDLGTPQTPVRLRRTAPLHTLGEAITALLGRERPSED
jgi:hypothetical protein